MKEPSQQPLRLLVVDDHQVVRMGLRLLEQDYPELQIVGEAATQEEALKVAGLLKPDALILDIRLGGGSGIETCRELKRRYPAIKVLMLTSFLSDDLIIDAISAGADGYLLKESNAQELVQALRTIRQGGIAMSSEVTRRSLQAKADPAVKDTERWVKEMTPQEVRILAALAEGRTNKEIADELGLSPMTVRNYLERIFLKMDVQRRSAAAVLYARAKAQGRIGNA